MSLSVSQLIQRLQAEVKDDPRIANLPVMLAQYDSESATENGYEPSCDIQKRCDYIVII